MSRFWRIILEGGGPLSLDNFFVLLRTVLYCPYSKTAFERWRGFAPFENSGK
jgi:hypothetical protein